jgi:hypothetical protein
MLLSINRATTGILLLTFGQEDLFQTGQRGGATRVLVQELSQQLYSWCTHLPPAIAWDDDQSVEVMEDIPMSNLNYSTYKQAGADSRMTDVLDFRSVLNAALRTRYKYAEYLIWRPYVFRALHFPGDLSEYDYECCSKALKVSLWPWKE